MPVLYVFGKRPVDVQDAVDQLVRSLESGDEAHRRTIFRHYVAHTHLAGTNPCVPVS